ncbi:MAG TPA: glycosyltransferase [Pyrinomonadaceae bacterium]|nr:glycosyltransferase [Pyrinomonadaceae bacterium]
MISGRDIVYISSIEWSFLWQGHQEIARRLAEAGNRVLYVENTGVRAPTLRDAGRVAFRLNRWARALASSGVREVAPNIYVCSPLVLPPFGPRWGRELNRRLLLPLVRRAARRLGMKDVLFWTYLPTDTTLDLIRLMRGRRSGVAYYCVADFTQLTPHADALRRSEQQTVEQSEVVFTNCSALARSFARWNPHTHVFPFGVNLDAFRLDVATPGGQSERRQPTFTPAHATDAHGANNSEASDKVSEKNSAVIAHQTSVADRTSTAVRAAVAVTSAQTAAVTGEVASGNGHRPASASELSGLPRPVIGYVGGMHKHVAFELLGEMARARPLWSWVCVGALQADVKALAGLPNVYLLGQRPHGELAGLVAQFDVCIVPYVNSVYTETVVPTKINEYLAMGKPVVSTDLPTVREFNEEHDVLLTAEARAASFLDAVERALRLPNDAATVAHRRRVAELGDWGSRFEAMVRLFEERLEAKGDGR